MGETKITQERRDKVKTSLEFLNIFLEGKKWSAGLDHYTVADLSILATVSGLFVSMIQNIHAIIKRSYNNLYI